MRSLEVMASARSFPAFKWPCTATTRTRWIFPNGVQAARLTISSKQSLATKKVRETSQIDETITMQGACQEFDFM